MYTQNMKTEITTNCMGCLPASAKFNRLQPDVTEIHLSMRFQGRFGCPIKDNPMSVAFEGSLPTVR